MQWGSWNVKLKRLLPAVLLGAFLAVGITLMMLHPISPLAGVGPAAPSSQKAALNYAVVIDAGSSGSRVYLYQWPPRRRDERGPQLLRIDQVMGAKGEPLVMTLAPGLSSCKDEPTRALAYIKPLLDFAAHHIPREAHLETQLFIMATAGLRLIPKESSAAILQELRTHIPLHYNFLLPEENVQVISGREEGQCVV